jgi:hypothetical protein
MTAHPDYTEEARTSLELFYEYNQPATPGEYTPQLRLQEAIAESLVSIAESLKAIVDDEVSKVE